MRIEGADNAPDFRQVEQAGAFRDQEADSHLDGGHVRDQVFGGDEAEEFAEVVEGGPGCEGEEGRGEWESGGAGERESLFEIAPGVAFVEDGEEAVIDGFDGADDERTTGLAEDRDEIAVLEKVLNLNGCVVGETREFGMESFDDGTGVAWAVEEIRVSECNVPSAGVDLLADIGKHDFPLHHAEIALIHGDDRAVAAKVLAAAGSLCIAGGASGAAG